MIRYTTHANDVDWVHLIADLEADRFHNGRTPQELEASFRNSRVIVIAWHGDRVIGTARALSDGVCNAYVIDVWTQLSFRRQGVARQMMASLEDRLTGQHVYLFTHDATALYEAIGYSRDGTGFGKVIGRWLGREAPRPPRAPK